MTENDRRDRTEELKRRLFRCTAAIALTAGLSACESVPDELNPGVWFEEVADAFDDEDPAARSQAGELQDGEYPNLAGVPDRPVTSIEERREALSRGLMAEDGEVAYSSQDLRAESGAPVLSPPPAQAVLRPEGVESPMPSAVEMARAEEESGFRGAFAPLGGEEPQPARPPLAPAPVQPVSQGASPAAMANTMPSAAPVESPSRGLATAAVGSESALAEDPRYAGPARAEPLMRPPEAPQPMISEPERPPLSRGLADTQVAQVEPERPPLTRQAEPVVEEPQRPPLARQADSAEPQPMRPPLVRQADADPYADLARQYRPAPQPAPMQTAPAAQQQPVRVATAAPVGEPRVLAPGASADPYSEYYEQGRFDNNGQVVAAAAPVAPEPMQEKQPVQASVPVGYVPPAMIQRPSPTLFRRSPAPASLQAMPPITRPIAYNPNFRAGRGAQTAWQNSMRVGTIFFDDGSAALSRDDRDVLQKIAGIYKQKGSGLLIMGHASYPTRAQSFPQHELINFRISGKRADNVANYLVRLGVPRRSIRIGAFSDSQPEYQESRKTGIAANRRVAVFLVP